MRSKRPLGDLHMKTANTFRVGIWSGPDGRARDCLSVQEAISVIDGYSEAAHPAVKFEIFVRYENGGKVGGEFHDKATAVEFLQTFQT
jgi:hypothetical protein